MNGGHVLKILCIALIDEKNLLGVSKKVRAQACALGELGEDVFLCIVNLYDSVTLYHYDHQNKTLEEQWSKFLEDSKETVSKYSKLCMAYEILKKIIEENGIEVTYFRKVAPFPCAVSFLKWLRSRNKTIFFEYPTYPYMQELKHAKNYKKILLDFFFRRKLEQQIDHFFIITDDKSASRIQFKNWTRFSNGFHIESVRKRNAVEWKRGEPLHCLVVANISFWHGLDRFIEGMKIYKSSPLFQKQKFFLHIVGEGPALPEIKKTVENCHLEEYVLFEGTHIDDELAAFFDRCHLAISSLGLHRKGLFSSSELKAREYSARGIPFICAHDDPDFPEGFKYMHKFPADNSPIPMEEVIDFAEQVLLDKDHPDKIRNYAIEHLSWRKKMQLVKERLKNT